MEGHIRGSGRSSALPWVRAADRHTDDQPARPHEALPDIEQPREKLVEAAVQELGGQQVVQEARHSAVWLLQELANLDQLLLDDVHEASLWSFGCYCASSN